MKIPAPAARALARHVSRAVERLDPARYQQEPAYVAALFARLDAVVYRGPNFTLELKSTVVCDRGPNSAESTWGADFGIVASITAKDEVVEKAVLGQAKHGSLVRLTPVEAEQFREQLVKMAVVTKATIGFEVPTAAGVPPTVRIVEIPALFGGVVVQSSFRRYEDSFRAKTSGEPPALLGPALPLGRYLYAEVLRCLHGDSDERLIKRLAHSSLATLRVEARAIV